MVTPTTSMVPQAVFHPCVDTLGYAPNEKDYEERGATEKRRLDRRVANQGSNLGCPTADT